MTNRVNFKEIYADADPARKPYEEATERMEVAAERYERAALHARWSFALNLVALAALVTLIVRLTLI